MVQPRELHLGMELVEVHSSSRLGYQYLPLEQRINSELLELELLKGLDLQRLGVELLRDLEYQLEVELRGLDL
jgi:hypothetical protein